jgi:hypothetical protein
MADTADREAMLAALQNHGDRALVEDNTDGATARSGAKLAG